MSSRRLLTTLVLLVLCAIGGFAIWTAGTHKSEHTQTQTTTQAPNQDVVGRNASFIVTEGEIKKWKMDAATATYNEKRTEAHLTNVKGEFYDKDGKAILQFTAPEGQYASKDNNVVLTGGVVATSTKKDGGELHAPTMSWKAKTEQVTASGGIKMMFAQGTSTAQVCRFTLDFSDISLEGGVSSTLHNPG